MLLETRYRIWEMVTPPSLSEARKEARYVSLQRWRDSQDRGVLVASNGFGVAVVPVALHKNDVPGLISASSLKDAVKAAGKVPVASIGASKTLIHSDDGVLSRMDGDGVSVETPYPDFWRWVPPNPGNHSWGTRRVGFSFEFMTKILRALGQDSKAHGGPEALVVITTGATPEGPIVITTTKQEGGRYEPPFGSLMPMRVPD